jgi:cob(I)alamin adenosyltransferase
MPIYTRTGDKGKTSLFDGTRVLKSHIRVETYGTIDELNSMIGAGMAQLEDIYSSSDRRGLRSTSSRQARTIKSEIGEIKQELETIQNDLLDIGSALATPYPLPVTGLEKRPKEFERMIDKLTAQLPELKSFILPGGSQAGSLLHVSRTITRRAERQLISLMQKEEVDPSIVRYLNRLSDLLFTMARFVNHTENKKENKWIKK